MPTPITTTDRTNVTPTGYDYNGVSYKKEARVDGQGNSYTVDVPQTPAAPATPAPGSSPTGEKTAGQIYDFGTQDPTLDAAVTARNTAASTAANTPIDENAIRQQKLAEMQAEIDAQNAIYNDKLRVAKVEGLGRLGSSTAIQGRRGLLGSDFGNAQTDTVVNGNTDIQNSIENERAAKIAQLQSDARTHADTEIAAKRAAKEAGLKDYVTYLNEGTTRKTTATDKVVAALVAQGVDPSTMDKASIDSIAAGYGIKSADIINAYKLQKYTSDKAKTDDAAKRKADVADALAKKGVENISEGSSGYRYNEATGQYELVAHVAKTYAPSSGTGTPLTGPGGTYVPGANPVVDAWASQIWDGTKKITDIPAKESGLRNAVVVALQANGNTLSGKPTVTELGRAAKNTAQDLLNKFNAGTGTSAVGKSAILGSLGYGLLPGTDRANFVNTLNTLKSQLSLDGVKYLKGQGAVSDAERALLSQAVTRLSQTQSEAEFKTTLEDIIKRLNGENVDVAPATRTVTAPDGTQVEITD